MFWVFLSAAFSVPTTDSCAQKNHPINKTLPVSNLVNGLHISLLTDKASYVKGEEIHFEAIFYNAGKLPFRILIDDTFVGDNIQCTDMQGSEYSFEGGYLTWSPKADLFTGRTYLLNPKDTITIKMDALISDNYRLIFSGSSGFLGSIDYEKIKKNKQLSPTLPDKYLCAGRIFLLQKPNKFRFTYLYETTNADKHWKFLPWRPPEETSLDLLWIGKAASNTIEISID